MLLAVYLKFCNARLGSEGGIVFTSRRIYFSLGTMNKECSMILILSYCPPIPPRELIISTFRRYCGILLFTNIFCTCGWKLLEFPANRVLGLGHFCDLSTGHSSKVSLYIFFLFLIRDYPLRLGKRQPNKN